LASSTTVIPDVKPHSNEVGPHQADVTQEFVAGDVPSALGAGSERVAVVADAIPEPAVSTAGTRVRSSAGVPLRYVEVRELAADAVGGWTRVQPTDDADELVVTVASLSELRAPGHVPVHLEVGVEELVLDP